MRNNNNYVSVVIIMFSHKQYKIVQDYLVGFLVRLGLDLLGRLGSGSFSLSRSITDLLPRQFPLAGSLQKELITRSAWVLWVNSCTFGLS